MEDKDHSAVAIGCDISALHGLKRAGEERLYVRSDAERVSEILDVLNAAGVRSFEGCGIKVQFGPPVVGPRESQPPTDPMTAEFARLESILKGRAV